MILSTERKVMVFFTPRTGSKALRTAVAGLGIPLAVCDEAHTRYEEMKEYPNLNEYTCYAFYRNPLDRCISIMNYLRRGRHHAKFFRAFYGSYLPASYTSQENYWEWEKHEMRQMCDCIPMIEVFRKLKMHMERGPYGKTHKPWLSGPVIPLNFEDYQNEVSKILTQLGVDNPMPIPKINDSITLPDRDALAPHEEAEIRDYLEEDYRFLESRGIKFA